MRQKLKIRKQKPEDIKENRRGTGYFFWEKSCLSLTASLLAALIFASGCATTTSVQEKRQIATLTAIDITDNTLNIKADKPFNYTIYKPSDPYKAIVELLDVRLGIAAGKIKSEKAGITEIMPSQTDEPLLTKLEILLSSPAGIVPAYKDTLLTLNIISLEEELKAKTTEKAAETPSALGGAEEKTQEVKAPAEKAEEPASMETKTEAAMPEKPAEEGKYKGQKISLDFQDADIGPIFRLLADISGYNFVIDPEVKGKITLKLMNVPWDQALDIILQTHGLDKQEEGNIMWIAPIAKFTKMSKEKTEAIASEEIAEELVQEVIRINYATSGDISGAIDKGKLLSSRGSITPDARMNTLIIKDTEKNINKIKELVKIMDVTKPQVMIEAKIVSVSSDYLESLGIRWGGELGTARPRVGFGDIDINSGTFSVNTPIATAGASTTNLGGVLGLSLGSATTVKVDLSLSALESIGKSRTLSNPKILTMDNETATIQQGQTFFVQTISDAGTKTEEKQATLSLTVTPKITPDGYIQLNIIATNDTLQPGTAGATAVINKESLTTKAIVKDGETLVLGGIYKTSTAETETGVPLLSKIPVLGWLFKTKTQTGPNVKEMLIFITPTIVTKL